MITNPKTTGIKATLIDATPIMPAPTAASNHALIIALDERLAQVEATQRQYNRFLMLMAGGLTFFGMAIQRGRNAMNRIRSCLNFADSSGDRDSSDDGKSNDQDLQVNSGAASSQASRQAKDEKKSASACCGSDEEAFSQAFKKIENSTVEEALDEVEKSVKGLGYNFDAINKDLEMTEDVLNGCFRPFGMETNFGQLWENGEEMELYMEVFKDYALKGFDEAQGKNLNEKTKHFISIMKNKVKELQAANGKDEKNETDDMAHRV